MRGFLCVRRGSPMQILILRLCACQSSPHLRLSTRPLLRRAFLPSFLVIYSALFLSHARTYSFPEIRCEGRRDAERKLLPLQQFPCQFKNKVRPRSTRRRCLTSFPKTPFRAFCFTQRYMQLCSRAEGTHATLFFRFIWKRNAPSFRAS